MQSRFQSAVESFFNIGSGMLISWFCTITILPVWLGVDIHMGQAMEITVFYTVISLTRTYAWRRLFNNAQNN